MVKQNQAKSLVYCRPHIPRVTSRQSSACRCPCVLSQRPQSPADRGRKAAKPMSGPAIPFSIRRQRSIAQRNQLQGSSAAAAALSAVAALSPRQHESPAASAPAPALSSSAHGAKDAAIVAETAGAEAAVVAHSASSVDRQANVVANGASFGSQIAILTNPSPVMPVFHVGFRIIVFSRFTH